MKEAGVVVAHSGAPIHWHLPAGRSAAAIPDTRSLWDVLYNHRTEVSGFAHSHPGVGLPRPSYTDVTTFAAIEASLGRRLNWWITSRDQLVLTCWAGPLPSAVARGVRWSARAASQPLGAACKHRNIATPGTRRGARPAGVTTRGPALRLALAW